MHIFIARPLGSAVQWEHACSFTAAFHAVNLNHIQAVLFTQLPDCSHFKTQYLEHSRSTPVVTPSLSRTWLAVHIHRPAFYSSFLQCKNPDLTPSRLHHQIVRVKRPHVSPSALASQDVLASIFRIYSRQLCNLQFYYLVECRVWPSQGCTTDAPTLLPLHLASRSAFSQAQAVILQGMRSMFCDATTHIACIERTLSL